MTDTAKDVLNEWKESAFYWRKHSDAIREMFAPLTQALIEAAKISSGFKVIDVAGGTGEPSLTIAELVGMSGRVVCSDGVAEMIAIAEAEAQRRRLGNIEFRHSLADSLPFKDNEFDVAVCRLGAMFFPAPVAAIKEMLRVIKPGGPLAFAVWGKKEFNPFFGIVTDVVSRYIEPAPEDPDAPGAFRFAESGKLSNALKLAGAIQITERAVSFRIEAPIALEQFWPLRSEISDSLRAKVAALTTKQTEMVAQDVLEAARQFFESGRMSFPAQVIISSARKPG